MSAMKQWSNRAGIESKEEELEGINKEIDETGRQIGHGTNTYQEDKTDLQAQTADVTAKHDRNAKRHEALMASITW